MKAIVYHNYGSPDVLELAEIEKPAPKADEVLIEVQAASVNPHDWHFLTGTPYLARLMAGPFKPKHSVLGVDVAGTVHAVGANVEQFQPGDKVCAMLQHGGFAQFACAAEDQVVRKPANMSFEDAAAVPLAALTALQCLRDHAQVQLGQRVLINGASGGVGTFAVQIAKLFGANVTGVCSTRNLDMVRAVGADQMIDYTLEDFTKTAQGYDLIFDAVRKRSFSECRRALGPQGIFVTTEVSPSLLLRGLWVSITGSQKLAAMLAQPDQKDLAYLIELVEAGKVKPVIDRSYTLSEVPDAIRYIGKGHARGKVVITL